MGSESPFKDDCLKGRVALITGGGSGIGFGIAKCLGQHGTKVVIMGRREKFLQDAVDKLKSLGVEASYFRGDVRSPDDAKAAVDLAVSKYGSLSILVNCAAGNFLAFSGDMTVNAFRTVMEIDTLGVFNMSRHAYNALKDYANSKISAPKAKGKTDQSKYNQTALVINISATLHYTATWYQTHATAAKAAIDSITRQLGLEWGEDGVRVVGIAPGPIKDTAGTAKLLDADSDASFLKTVPLKRMGTIDDIGLTAVFLASKAADYITSDTLIVDGGEWVYKPPPFGRDKVREISQMREGKSRDIKAKL